MYSMFQYVTVLESVRNAWHMKYVPNMLQTCQGFSSRTSLGWKVPICCLFCLLPGLQNLQQQHLPLHRSPVKMAPCENFNSEMFERVSKWYQVIHMWFFFQDFMVQKHPKTTMRVASKRNAQNAQKFWDGQSSNLYHVKVVIPWVWPLWDPLPVPIFFLSSMNREDRLTEPAEHLFGCNGFNISDTFLLLQLILMIINAC